jgi:hypothetical protein
MRTVQLVLVAVIFGLIAGHFLRQAQTEEGFEDKEKGLQGSPSSADPPLIGSTTTNGSPTEDDDDPRDLPWIASWSHADAAAREGHICAPTYVEIGPDGTTILTTSPSCEAGMPHTLAGDRIVIPSSVALADRSDILAHELIHIHQKRHPEAWLKFYRSSWAFTFAPIPPREMPATIVAARRSNPDTWEPRSGGPWACWRNRWWPVPIYKDLKTPHLRDCVTVWWDASTGEVLTAPPEDWVLFFGQPSQDEHPHEISAVKIVNEETSTEAGRRLLGWFRSQAQPHSA